LGARVSTFIGALSWPCRG